MECSVCSFRSPVGSCAECQALLCEVCGAVCDHCNKMACPDHLHETRHGHKLCEACHAERKTRLAKKKAAEDEQEGEPAGVPQAGVIEEEAFPERVPPAPWKLSLYAACVAAALILIMLVLPGLRRFPLPWGGYFPTPYALFVVLAIAIFWAARGLMTEEDYVHRRRCFIGLGIAVATAVLVFVAVYTDPARRAELEARQAQSARQNMTEGQLKNWREEKLKKFAP